MTNGNPDRPAARASERSRIPALMPVLIIGGVLTAAAGIFLGFDAAASTFGGLAVAVADLYILTRMVAAMVAIEPARQGARWAPVVLIKFLLLFSGVILLLSRKIFLPLPFLAGLGALPLGIVVGSLFRE